MPFVNEKISEEDKARIDWDQYRPRPSEFSEPVVPIVWTIDRERDVFFYCLVNSVPPYGYYESVYALSWKGSLIRVRAIVKLKDEPGFKKSNIYWDILGIDIPALLIDERPEIVSVLKEAIEAYGGMHHREWVDQIYISIR